MTAYTDFHYSPTGSGVISGAQVLEQTEQGINGLGQYVQDNVSGAIDVANQALTTAQSADSNATAAINLANSFNAQIIAANQTAGNALTTAQSAQNTANAASSLATTANNNAATALNTANAASAGVTTLTGTVNSLGNRMTAAENAISANAGNITTLQNNLATTNANVTAAANAASAAQATATSAQSTATQARNQAYVLRYTGTTITGGGTIAYADIDNTDNIKTGDKIIDISGAIYAIASVDTANQTVTVGASPVINLFCDAENLIPAANDAYDLGSSSYQWNNLYAKNYYYNGVAWGLDQANIWTKTNIFSDTLKQVNSAIIKGTNPQSDINAFNVYWGGTNVSSLTNALFSQRGIVYANGSTAYVLYALENVSGGTHTSLSLKYDPNDTINARSALMRGDFRPYYDNSFNLGISTHRWKSFNGVNPGALSLPDYTQYEPVNFSQWNTSGALTNTYTPTEDGWLFVNIKDTATNSIFIYAKSIQDAQSYSVSVYGNGSQGYLGRLSTIIPVIKGITYAVIIKAASVNDIYAVTFFPALGNV